MEGKKKCKVLKKLGKVVILRGLGQSGWEQEGSWEAEGNPPCPSPTETPREMLQFPFSATLPLCHQLGTHTPSPACFPVTQHTGAWKSQQGGPWAAQQPQ